MNDAVKEMLKEYGRLSSVIDEDRALREIVQNITLLGLQRGGLFEKAAFYGGTALRLLYGLDRFSEDLDFCLLNPDPSFTLKPYFDAVQAELERFDFSARLSEKRTGPEVAVESAFVKQSTYQGLLVIGANPRRAHKEQLLKVRIEVDKLNPPAAVETDKLIHLPIPFLLKTLNLPSLFAGKIHAILARAYLNRVKGRDYYDFAFLAARNTPINLDYLEAKLRDSEHYVASEGLSHERLIELLKEKFQSVDFAKAKADVTPFLSVSGVAAVEQWSAKLFSSLAEQLPRATPSPAI